MITKTVKINELNPAPYNPRVDLKEGMDEWKALNNSLDKFGLVIPIVVNERNNTIISGHQRIAVLKSQGVEETEAVMLDLDKEDEKRLNIALNKIEGEWDFEKLENILSEMTPEEKMFTGFLEEDIDELNIVNRDTTPREQTEPPFDIYVSFESRDTIKGWLEEHDLKAPEITPVTIIDMEGK